MSDRSVATDDVADRKHPAVGKSGRFMVSLQGESVKAHVATPSRRWAVLALAVFPILLLAGCGSSDPYPAASPAVSSACSDLDKYYLNQTAPQSELNKVLKEAKQSGDTVLAGAARAYQAAVAPFNQSAKNEAFAKMVGRCQYFGIGPGQNS
jgi:hypothetical protein